MHSWCNELCLPMDSLLPLHRCTLNRVPRPFTLALAFALFYSIALRLPLILLICTSAQARVFNWLVINQPCHICGLSGLVSNRHHALDHQMWACKLTALLKVCESDNHYITVGNKLIMIQYLKKLIFKWPIKSTKVREKMKSPSWRVLECNSKSLKLKCEQSKCMFALWLLVVIIINIIKSGKLKLKSSLMLGDLFTVILLKDYIKMWTC